MEDRVSCGYHGLLSPWVLWRHILASHLKTSASESIHRIPIHESHIVVPNTQYNDDDDNKDHGNNQYNNNIVGN